MVRKLAGYQTGTHLCMQGWKKEFSLAILYFDSWITLQIHSLHSAVNKSICILKKAQISPKCTQLIHRWKQRVPQDFLTQETTSSTDSVVVVVVVAILVVLSVASSYSSSVSSISSPSSSSSSSASSSSTTVSSSSSSGCSSTTLSSLNKDNYNDKSATNLRERKKH